MWRELLYGERCKVYWKYLPSKFDLTAEIQEFIEYIILMLILKFSAKIPFTPSYLELWAQLFKTNDVVS